MDTKNFLASKINWVAILTIILGALTAAQSAGLSPVVTGYIVTAIGIVNFVLRTFFTTKTVTVLPKDEFNG